MLIRNKWLVATVFTQVFTTQKMCLAMGFEPTIDLLHSAAGALPLSSRYELSIGESIHNAHTNTCTHVQYTWYNRRRHASTTLMHHDADTQYTHAHVHTCVYTLSHPPPSLSPSLPLHSIIIICGAWWYECVFINAYRWLYMCLEGRDGRWEAGRRETKTVQEI